MFFIEVLQFLNTSNKNTSTKSTIKRALIDSP